MSDPLTDLITDIQNNGVRWVSLVTILALYRKERRNLLLNKRDAALFHNQRIIMDALGRADEWKDGPKLGFQPTDLPNLKQLSIMCIQAIKTHRSFYPRRKTKMKFLKSSISKKLFTILIGVAVTALNNKFNLQLSENDIYIMFAGIITYIAGQSHVDAKKALANTVKAISVGVQAAVPNIEPMPDVTYAELVPTIKTVHDGINNLLKNARLNDGSQAFKDASQAYFAIVDIIQRFKQPEPLPIIPDEQVSA